MKKTLKSTLSIVLSLLFLLCLVSCNNASSADVWESATYKTDTEWGSGAKTLVVEVKVNEHIVTFTIKTDKDTVGDALIEHNLISGEDGAYGMYVKVVNGMTADYDIDKTYWLFYINGEYGMTGVDTTEIAEGSVYQLVYTK